MKSNLILIAVAAGALAFTACNKKINDKTMADINQFQTDWTATGAQAATFSQDLNTEKTKCNDHVTKQTAMVTGSMDKIKDETTKAKMGELDKNDHEAVNAMENMSTSMNDFNTQWNTNTTAWTEWKAKVDKGQVSDQEATKAMADWNTKLNDAKGKLSGMQTSFNTVKDNCEKNMAECDAMGSSNNTAEATTTSSTTTKTKTTTKVTDANGHTTKTSNTSTKTTNK